MKKSGRCGVVRSIIMAATLDPQYNFTFTLNAETPSVTHLSPSIAVSNKGILSIISNETILSARITDLSGKSVLYCEPNANQAILDIGWASYGIYFISARTPGAGYTKALTRQRWNRSPHHMMSARPNAGPASSFLS